MNRVMGALNIVAGVMCVVFGALFAFGIVSITFGAIVIAVLGFGTFMIITGLEGLKREWNIDF